MDATFLNLAEIGREMASTPKGQRLHNFFSGATGKLNSEQKENLKQIIKEKCEEALNFIDESLYQEKNEIELENED